MDDINFEELDKAVNSALQQTSPKGAPVQEEPVSDIPDVAVEVVAPSVDARKDTMPSAPPRRRGQFMDMVHPSSDMIKPSISTRPSRQAATLQPLNPSIVETSERDEPAQSTAYTPVATPKEASVADEPAAKSEWPDPLDVMEQTSHEKHDDIPQALDESTTLISEVADDSDNHPENNVSEETENEGQDAAISPFINGTGLEKRPLGAFADAPVSAEAEEPAAEGPDEPDATEPDAAVEQDDTQQELPVVPIPQELTPEVVSVESDEMHHSDQEDTIAPDEDSNTVDAGAMTASISPQYKSTEVPSEDQNNHPVFDTKEYHQPLTPPAKRGHAGLMVTIVLILLALLGAGAWYAVAVLKLI